MLSNGLKDFDGKNVLMLQGPIGPFFYRFSKKLQSAGANVYKINFNGGDFIFYPFGSVNFNGKMDDFYILLKDFCISNHIDAIMVFNDCRPVHSIAKNVAKELNINLGVFEEGYIRPDYITFENEGVNGHSQIPKVRSFYDEYAIINESGTRRQVGNTFPAMAFYASCYWFFAILFGFYFNNSLHHRSLSIFEAYPWLISFWRKLKYKRIEKNSKALIRTLPKQYFLVALQVHNDTQISSHYDGASIGAFIEDTILSFAKHSETEQYLVIKHHPMDRGYCEYSSLINDLAIRYGVSKRVFYIHDEHLPTLLENALGCVVINSTVGVSALHHNCPVKVCGNAFYDIDGLTFQGSLDYFWREAKMSKPDHELYLKFKNYLILKTQINGSFYT